MFMVTHGKSYNTWNWGSLNGNKNKKLCKEQQMTPAAARLQTASLWGDDSPGNHQGAAKPDLLQIFSTSERQPVKVKLKE